MIPVLSGSSEWFAQRNLEYLFFWRRLYQNESFPTRSLQNVRNLTQIVIYFDGRNPFTFIMTLSNKRRAGHKTMALLDVKNVKDIHNPFRRKSGRGAA